MGYNVAIEVLYGPCGWGRKRTIPKGVKEKKRVLYVDMEQCIARLLSIFGQKN